MKKRSSFGVLYLIATPICDEIDLHQGTKDFLRTQLDAGSIIAVEEAKPCRRRWLSWGLPREAIEDFEIYNEHNRETKKIEFIQKLKKGINVCLMSDCGLPAFCDPGQELVELAHGENIRVSATSFDNSIVLALALSGFPHSHFWFAGFLPKEKEQRAEIWKKIQKRGELTIIMDTPYRLTRVLEEILEFPESSKWSLCLATQLGHTDEAVVVSDIKTLNKHFNGQKREFIMVIQPRNGRKN